MTKMQDMSISVTVLALQVPCLNKSVTREPMSPLLHHVMRDQDDPLLSPQSFKGGT